ncbi:MAG: heavy-metal-associated domain-containing protein [Muribaculaceae bacterium]|nr:heavy-metal-associated domain-containing protein [Muribaculaceae bacterium]
MTKNTFTVTGMRCVNCKANVERAIKALPGVVEAVVSLEDACVVVEYDEAQVTPQDMKDAVEDLGRFEMTIDA